MQDKGEESPKRFKDFFRGKLYILTQILVLASQSRRLAQIVNSQRLENVGIKGNSNSAVKKFKLQKLYSQGK